MTKPGDLIGRRIGLINGSVTVDEYRALIAANGLDGGKIHEVAVGWDVAPLLAGQVDGLMNYAELTPVELRLQGKAIETMRLADFGVRAYGLDLIVNELAMKADSTTYLAMRDAIIEGYRFVRENPDSAAVVFAKMFPERDTAFVHASMREVAKLLGTGAVGAQSAAGWDSTTAMLTRLGLLTVPIPGDSVMIH